MPETIQFQALGIIESKTVWETVLAWAQKLKSEGAQYKLNKGCGLCQKDKVSKNRKILRQTSYFDFIRRRPLYIN